jgi:hypothetical protein
MNRATLAVIGDRHNAHMSADRDRTSAGQIGLITLQQLRDFGLTAPQVRREVVVGDLVPIRARVYRERGAPIGWEQTVLAAALSAGKDFFVSHETAAALWDLRHSDRDQAGIHLSGDRRVRIAGVTGHLISLTKDERGTCRQIPVTTPERTIIDLAGKLTAAQLSQCVDDALRRRILSIERLRRLVEAAPTRGGQRPHRPIRDILADRMPGYRPDDSELETEMNRLWDQLGLPPARRQHRITIDGHNYRLDRAIVECKIGTEWDSYRYHSSPSDRDYDSNRRARLVGAGWLIIPLTGKSKPELVARAVLHAYADRGSATGPSNVTAGQEGGAV